MEHIFGSNDCTGEELLKTVGAEHTDLSGFQQTVREYPDCTITDSFYVVQKKKSDEDDEGNCYDWYLIDRHSRIIDRTGPIATREAQNAANIDYLSMMTGVDLPNAEGGTENG